MRLTLLASTVASFLASSSAPTPIYAIYASQWNFSPITTTIVFGTYAIAVLAALLVLGRTSDHLGRKPVLLAALALQILAMVAFSAAGGIGALFAGRILQGIATGAALGALVAAMLDIDRERGTLANAAAPGLGSGTGALLSGLLVQYLPAPTHGPARRHRRDPGRSRRRPGQRHPRQLVVRAGIRRCDAGRAPTQQPHTSHRHR